MTTKTLPPRQQQVVYANDAHLTVEAGFQTLCPRQTEEERALLKADIEANGCRDAIKVWGNIPVDGHTRLEFCEELGIEFPIERIDFPDDDAAKKWIIENQLGRRNLSPGQYSELRAQLYEAEKNDRGDDRKSEEKSKPQNEVLISTAEKVAKKTGVSKATIERDVAYHKALDSLVPAIRDGIRDKTFKCAKADVIKLAAMTVAEQEHSLDTAKLADDGKIMAPKATVSDATNGKPKAKAKSDTRSSDVFDAAGVTVPKNLEGVFGDKKQFASICKNKSATPSKRWKPWPGASQAHTSISQRSARRWATQRETSAHISRTRSARIAEPRGRGARRTRGARVVDGSIKASTKTRPPI